VNHVDLHHLFAMSRSARQRRFHSINFRNLPGAAISRLIIRRTLSASALSLSFPARLRVEPFSLLHFSVRSVALW